MYLRIETSWSTNTALDARLDLARVVVANLPSMGQNSRGPLIDEMKLNASKGLNCASCIGECCTSKSNSMQITSAEAADIVEDLKLRNLLDESLLQRLKDCIATYRLDVDVPSYGSRPNFRRTYTCPFYSPGPTGCSLSLEAKPHGCLAFNPNRPDSRGLTDGCSSNQGLIARCYPESATDEKYPIPVAILKILA